MEEAIIQRLLATAGVTALLSDRVHPMSLPQGAELPAATFRIVNNAPIYTDDGETGLNETRFEVNCWANTYTEAKQLARAVKSSLSDFIGTSEGVTFQNTLIETERDSREGGGNSESYRFGTAVEFRTFYEGSN